MKLSRSVMLVSDAVDARRRSEVAAGTRPRPEYLVLESDHGVELADWTRIGASPGRSRRLSVRHATWALAHASRYRSILSDGEHLGIPVALGKRALGIAAGHVVIGHHLTTPAKRPYFRILRAQAGISKLMLHSPRQAQLATSELGIRPERVSLVSYAVDQHFWSPRPRREEALVVAVGREHRDYTTLAAAGAHLPLRFFVAASSSFSPQSACSAPVRWPANFTCRPLPPEELRELYARASLVVVPLLETDFQAGVTTMLEAMSMAKPVLVTRTTGRPDALVDGVTGVFVAPGNAAEMADAIVALMADARQRRRLGDSARDAVQSAFTVDHYAARLAAELEAAAEDRG